MLTNLFSVFDPVALGGFNANWISILLSTMALPLVKSTKAARAGQLYRKTVSLLWSEVVVLLPLRSHKVGVVFLAFFSFIALSNSLGLIPYVFTVSSHLVVTLGLALPLCLGFFSQGWWNNSGLMLAHLVPLGTPSGLMPFMVVIESVSSLIRPVTLSVRLAANMIAGHLLLALVGGSAKVFAPLLCIGVILSQASLAVLEAAVAVIQAYVFMILSVLYTSEVL